MEHARQALTTEFTGNVRRGGLSAAALKTIAILAMLVDHAARAFVTDYYGMPGALLHMLGRITGPIMFYFIVEGYHHTRNPKHYTLRMAVFAAVSYLPFIYFKHGGLPTAATWLDLNVIYTLLLGLLMLRARHEVQDPAARVLLMALCFIFCFVGDWSYMALLYIWVFDQFYGNFRMQAFGYTLVSLTRLLPPAAQLLTGWLNGAGSAALWSAVGQLTVFAGLFLPLLLLRFYNGKLGGGRAAPAFKWLFYLFYPAHLAILGLLQKLVAWRI